MIIITLSLIIILISLIFRPILDKKKLEERTNEAYQYCQNAEMNQQFCLLVDYSIHSGMKRLFVWNFKQKKVVFSCLVAHGHGHHKHSFEASNVNNSFLSSVGKCKISERYVGKFGVAYRLDGLDSTNSNVRLRNIVIHGFKAIPNFQVFPFKIPRSKGCIAVSTKSMSYLDSLLENEQNVLLYTYYY